MTYDLSDVPTIRGFWKATEFQQMLMGPFGSGKSSGCVNKLVALSARQAPWSDGIRRNRVAVIRNTYPQLRDTTISTWMDWWPPQVYGRHNEQTHNYLMKFRDEETGDPVELEVRFRALDRPDQVGNLLSAEYGHAWCNEAREEPLTVWDAVCGRVARYPPRKEVPEGTFRPCVMGDTNPPDDDSWIYQLFEEGLAPDGRELMPEELEQIRIFKQPSGLSPEAENLSHLDPEYYRRLAMGKSADFIQVYVHGQYGSVVEGKPVYPEYLDSTHCREFDIDPRWPVYRGWDFGLTPACVFTCLTPTGQWRIFDEVIATRMGARNMARQVNLHTAENWSHLRIEGDYGDPAGNSPSESEERSCFQVLRSEQIPIMPGEQALERRLDAVRTRLSEMVDGEPALLIHPRCRMLRKGFRGGYQYKRLKISGERYTEKPDKNEASHPHDGLQYVATKLFAVTGTRRTGRAPRVNRSRGR